MKSLFTVLLFLFSFCSVFAQTDSVYAWNKWCASRDTLVLFNTGNNTINVYIKNRNPSSFKLKSLDKSLRIGNPEIKGDTMMVLAMPYPTKDKQMRLAVLDSKTSKTIKILNFSSQNIPEPQARIGNIRVKESYKKTILSQVKLIVEFPNSLYSYPYTVKHYVFKAPGPKGNYNIPVNSFFLNTLVIKAISELPEGTQLEFTGIKVTCPECATRLLDDLKIKIKVSGADSTAKPAGK